jgi:hypothetical protein
MLEDGGKVEIVRSAAVGAPFASATDDPGLNAQATPEIATKLQDNATELEALLRGMTFNAVIPDCPAAIFKLGVAAAMLKSGTMTLTEIKADD